MDAGSIPATSTMGGCTGFDSVDKQMQTTRQAFAVSEAKTKNCQ